MKLVILGSGTSIPHPERSSSAYWIETARGSLMLDFSASALHRMAEERLDWAGLDAIWISHFHLDHCAGITPFLFGTKYAPETQGRAKPLRVFGPKGLRRLLQQFDDANAYGLFDQPFPLQILEVDPLEDFRILEDLTAVTFDTPHTGESRAIRLEESGGGSLVFTSDTGFTKTLGAFAKNTDVLMTECSFVREKPVEKHLELAEALFLARYSNAGKTILTHLYPEWDGIDFDAEIGRFDVNREVIEARDGLSLII